MRLKVERPLIKYLKIIKTNSKNLELYLNNYRVIIDHIDDNRYYFSAIFLFIVKLTVNTITL